MPSIPEVYLLVILIRRKDHHRLVSHTLHMVMLQVNINNTNRKANHKFELLKLIGVLTSIKQMSTY